MHLIIVVEADNESKSDYHYINKYLYAHYAIDSGVKLSPIYMGGKGNFKSVKIENDIRKKKKAYESMHGKNAPQIVLLCVDTDDLAGGLNTSENKDQIERIEGYCSEKGYELVWFCRDIEEVFIGKRVSRKDKTNYAKKFSLNEAKKISLSLLRCSDYNACREKTSNLDTVIKHYLRPLTVS